MEKPVICINPELYNEIKSYVLKNGEVNKKWDEFRKYVGQCILDTRDKEYISANKPYEVED